MGEILAIPTLLLLLAAPFIAINTYLLVWICGPAIRHAGKCFEQGRQQAIAQPRAPSLPGKQFAPFGYNDPPRAKDATLHSSMAVQPAVAGKQDAGHRWLGDEKDKSA
jgi:hypothetical protein